MGAEPETPSRAPAGERTTDPDRPRERGAGPAPPRGPRAVLRLQANAGNAAVAALLAQGGGVERGDRSGAEPTPPPPIVAPIPRVPGRGAGEAPSPIVARATPPSATPEVAGPATLAVAPSPAIPLPTGASSPGAASAPAIVDGATRSEPVAPGEADAELATLDRETDAPAPVGTVDAVPGDAGPSAAPLSGAESTGSEPPLLDPAEIAIDADGAEPTGGGSLGGTAGVALDGPPATSAAPLDLSAADPSAGLASLAGASPGVIVGSLASVGAAASRVVADERSALAAAPPERHFAPSGTPDAGTDTPRRGREGPTAVRRATPKARIAPKQPKAPAAAPAPRVAAIPTPTITEAADGKVAPDDGKRAHHELRSLPTRDTAPIPRGAPQQLDLRGEGDPAHVDEQRAHFVDAAGRAQATAAHDVAEPAGERDIQSTLAPETLRASVTLGADERVGGAAVQLAANDEVVALVAQQERGGEIRGALSQGARSISAARQDHTQRSADERAGADAEIALLQTEQAAQQHQERTAAQADVATQRSDWAAEHRALVTSHGAEVASVAGDTRTKVDKEREAADREAQAHYEQGDAEAAQAQRDGDQEAARAKTEGEKESSGGFLGWLGSKVKSLFNKVKNAINTAFERARKLVRAAIQKAQQLATAVIEKARQVVVGVIRAAGAAIVAIGDRLLAAFPKVRERFRNAIKARVDAAVRTVNRIADRLKAGVKRALDALAKGLDALLAGLQKAMLAAVAFVQSVVVGAIEFARKAIQALGVFAALIGDIARGPGAWLRNLGSAVKDGIQNHLWREVKGATQGWFGSKVESVVGLGSGVYGLLKKGGFGMAKVGQMVWSGIKAAIPTALIAVLVERLLAMLVPLAGAVMAIIQGLRAAWGAAQRFIAAIGAFVTFLKAVKLGNAGQLFAKALAAGAVAVLEFVSQFLLVRLRKAAVAVGNRLRAMAKRIGERLKLGRGKRGAKDTDRSKGTDAAGTHKPGRETPQERLDRAVAAIQPKVPPLLAKRVSGLGLRTRLAMWRVQYRLTELKLIPESGGMVRLHATVNPSKTATSFAMPQGEVLRKLINRASVTLLNDPRVQEAARRQAKALTTGSSAEAPVAVGGGGDVLGLAVSDRYRRSSMRQLLALLNTVIDTKDVTAAQVRIATLQAAWAKKRGGAPGERGDDHATSQVLQILNAAAGGKDPKAARREVKAQFASWKQRWFSLGDVPIHEFVRHLESTNSKVRFPGGSRYPQIAAELKESGFRDAQIGAGLRTLIQSGKFPDDDAMAKNPTLAALALLMFGRESARNKRNVVHAAMVTELMESGGLTAQEAFGVDAPGKKGKAKDAKGSLSTGGALPMTMESAAAGARAYDAVHSGDAVPAHLAKWTDHAAEIKRRELALAEQWLAMKLKAEGYVAFENLADAEQFVVAQLRAFYFGKVGGGA